MISLGSLTALESFFRSSTTAFTALSIPRLMPIGFEPAVTFRSPSRKIASASTVAVVVPSPATSEVFVGDLAHHLGAHVLVAVLELDLLGHGHTVLGDRGRAPLLVEHDVAPRAVPASP